MADDGKHVVHGAAPHLPAEYNNAVRDIFGIDAKIADNFPADDSGYGFDNIADVLSVPPV